MLKALRLVLLAVLLAVGLQVPALGLHGDRPNPDGGVPPTEHPYGDPARQGIRLVAPVVDHAHVPNGYWIAAADSGIFSYGAAPYQGNLYDQGVDPRNLVGPVFDIVASGSGYWLFATDGGVFSFGPQFYGSASGMVPAGAKVIYAGTNPGLVGYDMADSAGNIWRCQGTCVLINPPLRVPAPPPPPRPTVCGQGPGDGRIGWDDVAFLNAINAHVRGEYHCWLVKIVNCESGWDQYAKNRNSTATGYAQFLRGWWGDARPGDPFDPVWQAVNIQYLLDNGGKSHWECHA